MPKDYQTIRLIKRQRPQQHGIHHAEDRGVGADAQSEYQNCNDCEARTFAENAPGVASVLT